MPSTGYVLVCELKGGRTSLGDRLRSTLVDHPGRTCTHGRIRGVDVACAAPGSGLQRGGPAAQLLQTDRDFAPVAGGGQDFRRRATAAVGRGGDVEFLALFPNQNSVGVARAAGLSLALFQDRLDRLDFVAYGSDLWVFLPRDP